MPLLSQPQPCLTAARGLLLQRGFCVPAAQAISSSSWPVKAELSTTASSGGSFGPVQRNRPFPSFSLFQGKLESWKRPCAGFATAATSASKHGVDSDGHAVHLIESIDDVTAESLAMLKASKLLAVDCEGVDLSRVGAICLVQLSTPTDCFLFDVHGTKRSPGVVELLKELLESPDITKVIHDCKMDADALYHQLGIALTAVHDTQAWNKVLSGGREDNLNNTLVRYDCKPNADRDKSVYKTNPAFWATRPLTPRMIEWATGDVQPLFALHEKQLSHARPEQLASCEAAARENTTFLRSMALQTVSIKGYKAGRLIGPAGSNLRQLQQQVPGSFHQFRSDNGRSDLLVYGRDEATLAAALKLIEPYQ